MSTDFTQNNGNLESLSNEHDNLEHSSETEYSEESLKANTKDMNENNVYSEITPSDEMHYNPDSNDNTSYYNTYNNSNQLKYNEGNTNNMQIQSFDTVKKLEEEKEILHDEIRELNNKLNKFKKRNKDLQFDYDNLQEKYIKDMANKVNKDHKIKSEEQNIVDQLQQSLNLKENQIQNLEKEKEKLETKNNNLAQRNTNLENKLGDLTKQNALLEDEAANYQSALGVATNFQLRDDDQNHGVKLNNTISELNDNIKKYVTNLKQDIVVNIEEVKKLLILYKCPTKITSQKKDRILIQAVLQRHVMETIFEYANQYFGQTEKHEADIVRNETLLSELLAHTSKCRAGDDEITRVGPTKLRQQIYSILSNRGFANVIDNKGEREHPFISSRKDDLNKVMNQLRTIKDDGKKITSENLAETIIREVVKLFWFRLKVQEPVAEYYWIPNNTKVDLTIMEANQPENDDDLNVDTYVNLCYFPQIGKDLDTKNPKTYTLAKVISRDYQYDYTVLEDIPQQPEKQNQEQPTHDDKRKISSRKQNQEPPTLKQKTSLQKQDQEQQPQKQKSSSIFSGLFSVTKAVTNKIGFKNATQ
ncbi:hypothetical protein RclHR1_15260003 [Rhizophagus clarus]|uniref:Uncharacterized protein n=1 Tax=Rhizophagus clarus TaxID=94130 RepID=A0A2Z6QER2_9GLOM|nr:hypothetical protein RclHR1_15260003 [Rhizophagus clarus]GES97297.1 hypothetical protein GLOIN_2v1847773 [Rhizophagus clarus]